MISEATSLKQHKIPKVLETFTLQELDELPSFPWRWHEVESESEDEDSDSEEDSDEAYEEDQEALQEFAE